jgi:hypothetical protein
MFAAIEALVGGDAIITSVLIIVVGSILLGRNTGGKGGK